jgi:hypothetical protein
MRSTIHLQDESFTVFNGVRRELPLISALGRQRQVDYWVRGQPGLQSEFQDSQGYKETLSQKPFKKKKKKKKERENSRPSQSFPNKYGWSCLAKGKLLLENEAKITTN